MGSLGSGFNGLGLKLRAEGYIKLRSHLNTVACKSCSGSARYNQTIADPESFKGLQGWGEGRWGNPQIRVLI